MKRPGRGGAPNTNEHAAPDTDQQHVDSSDTVAAALSYRRGGWMPVLLRPRSKEPIQPNWQKRRLRDEEIRRIFAPDNNVGILLGEASDGLVDIDLDCDEARLLAPTFLPETAAIFGRAGAPESHRFYRVNGAVNTTRFAEPASESSTMLVEIRCDGAQTMVPPSRHPCGELLAWESEGEPAVVEIQALLGAVRRLAAAIVLARHWPGPGPSQRHDAALALAGLLLRAGWRIGEARLFVVAIAKAAGDDEADQRQRDVASTAAKVAAAESVRGAPALAEILPPNVVYLAAKWLGIPWAEPSGTSGTPHPRAWGARLPLPEPLAPVSLLRPSMIPEPFRDWVQDVTERMQIDLSLVATPQIVAAGAVIGTQMAVLPKRNDDWYEFPNLWGACIAPPGYLKSPASGKALGPIQSLAERASAEFKHKSAEAKPRLEVLAERKKEIKRRLRCAFKEDDEEAVKQLTKELADVEKEERSATPIHRRYVTNDPTVESLGEIIRDNPRGLLLERDEIAGWLAQFERSGREGDREFFLEAWSGKNPFTVDRIQRGTIHVPALCLSVFGTSQPDKFAHYVKQATTSGSGNDGLLQRFQLLVYPDMDEDWRNVDRKPDAQARERVDLAFQRLDAIAQRTCLDGISFAPGPIPAMHFDEAAQERFTAWQAELEKRVRSGAGTESPAMVSHLAKYRSLTPTLALIFHLVDIVDGSHPGPISERALGLAIDWAVFLEEHARRVYGIVDQRRYRAARALAQKIEEGRVTDGASVRSVYRHHWKHLDSQAEVEEALDVLERHRWVRVEDVTTGGRNTTRISLHPELARGHRG